MKKKILIVGEYYSDNLGDGIICENVKYILSTAFPYAEIDIADVMGLTSFNDNAQQIIFPPINEQSKISKLDNWLNAKNGSGLGYFYERLVYQKWKYERKEGLNNIKQFLNRKYDLVVFAGGQLLYEPFVIPIERFVEILVENGTPVIFNGCGIGSFNNSYILSRFNRILKSPNIKSISARDHIDEVNELILKDNSLKAIKTSDPALWTKETYDIIKIQTRKTIGLGVIHRDDSKFMEKQRKLYKEIILMFESRGLDWELFSNGEIADQDFAYELVQEMNFSKEKVAARKKRPNELVNLIASYNSMISFRLHSHIVATSLRVPSVGMTWDKKVDYFFETFNSEDRCFSVDSNSRDIVNKIIEIDNCPLDPNDEVLSHSKENLENILVKEVSKYI